MTKQEVEEKIKNNESVWYISKKYIDYESIEEIKLNENYVIETKGLYNFLIRNDDLEEPDRYISELEYIFNSKAQAQHYLDNGNVTRTEKLPYVTWEEFNKNTNGIEFKDSKGNKYRFHLVKVNIDNKISHNFITLYDKNGSTTVDIEWKATEENFYKAYDVARKLFLGEKI